MIFNKENNGADELKELIGFINADITFANLKTYIDFAERDLKKIIGPEIFQVAEIHYHSNHYQMDENDSGSGVDDVMNVSEDSGDGSGYWTPTYAMLDTLVNYIQLPVAFHADFAYEQSNDLSHGNKGRRMLVSDEEKLPFKWLIKQDNDNILSLAYKATDVLLDYLTEKSMYFPEWKYGDAHSLFINRAEEFDKIFPIDKSRRMFLLLVPFIKEAEKKYIRPVITKQVFDDLKLKIKVAILSENEKEYVEMINVPLALYAMATAARRLPVQVLPSGLFQGYEPETNSLNAKKSADMDAKMNFIINLENDAADKMKDLMQYVKVLTEGGFPTPVVLNKHDKRDGFFRP